MISLEGRVLAYSGVHEQIESSFTQIQMEGVPLLVRTHRIMDPDKPPLVLLHGYLSSSICWVNMLKALSERFSLVFFDIGGHGINSKLRTCSAMDSAEAAEEWLIEWMLKTLEALDLPERFYLSGHSMGGYLASLYASKCPQRIISLFLISPGGTEAYNEATYDPYSLRDPADVTRCQKKKDLDELLKYREAKLNIVEEKTRWIPRFVVRRALIEPRWNRICKRTQDDLREAIKNYVDESLQKTSVFETVVLMTSKHPMFAFHPLQAADRLGNPAIDFPIGAVFGDRDYMGSEGTDEIVKNNKHFQSGGSQIFKLDDCSHEMTYDQPGKLAQIMIDFFEGTVKGKFELKPKDYMPLAQ